MVRLVGRCSVAQNLIMANNILPFLAAIAGIAFYGVDDPILNLLYNANMISKAVLRPGAALAVPVKVDNVAGARLIAVVLP